MRCLVSLDGVFVEFPRSRELWIPAFAGMTDNGVDSRGELWIPAFAGMTDNGVDSRVRGNCGFPPSREWRTMGWIPACAGMADDGVDSRLRGNDGRWGGFLPAREWR